MEDQHQIPAEQRFYGTAVSRGIGIGKAVLLNRIDPLHAASFQLGQGDPEREINRLLLGFNKAHRELSQLAGSDPSGIFDVHLLILEDAFGAGLDEYISENKVSAEAAVTARAKHLAGRQQEVSDSHIREKYLDIYDVSERLVRAITSSETLEVADQAGSIFIINELTPSLLSELADHHPRALIAGHGGWTSHTSILAREYRLPAVSGVRDLGKALKGGDLLIVDGFTGTVVLNPTAETVAEFARPGIATRRPPLSHDMESGTQTADGVDIVVRVNANVPEVYERARRAGAVGIGLYRSEILFDRHGAFPGEDEQYEAYREIGTLAGEAGVRIRTFDLGVDRLPDDQRYSQRNPALGLRAIRYSLAEPEHFRTQIRAILRASRESNVDIVLPMVTGTRDVHQARRLIEEEAASLKARSIDVGQPRLGVMIETPSAVLTAKEIGRHVNFFCLGTNDLVQYLLAVDRDDPSVAAWYQTLHPAVISALRSVTAAGIDSGIPVTVCGEMAGSTYYVPLLLGLGVREISINVNSVAAVRGVVADLDILKCSDLAEKVAATESSEEAEGVLKSFYEEHWPFIMNTAR